MFRYVCFFLLAASVCLAPTGFADAPQDRVSVPLGEFTSFYESKWTHTVRFEEAIARAAGTPLARAPLHFIRIASDGKIRFFYRSRLRSNGEATVGVQVEVFRQQSEAKGEWERVWSSKAELADKGTSEGDEISPILTVPVGFGAAPVATFRVVATCYAGDRATQPTEATFSVAFPSRFYVPFTDQIALEPGALWLDAHVSRHLYTQLRQSLEQFREKRFAPKDSERPIVYGPGFSPEVVQVSAAIVERLRDVAVPGTPQRTSALGNVSGSLASLQHYLRAAAVVAPRVSAADLNAMQVFNRKYLDAITAVNALLGDGDGSLQRLAETTRPYFVAAVGGTASMDYAPLQQQLWAVIGNVALVQQALRAMGDYAPPVNENGTLVLKPARVNFAPAASAFGDFFLRVNAHLAALVAFYERMDTHAQGAELAAYKMPPSPEQLVLTVGNSRPNDAGLHKLAANVHQTFTVTADGQPVPDADVSFYRVTVRDGEPDAPEPERLQTDKRGRVTFAPAVGGYYVQAEKDDYISALFVFEAHPTPQAQRPPEPPPALPDLVVTDVQTNSAVGYLVAQQPAWLFARVANIGRGDAQGPIYVMFEGKRGTNAFDRFEVIGIAAVPRSSRIAGATGNGQHFDSTTVRTDWVPPAPGDYTLRVTVNPSIPPFARGGEGGGEGGFEPIAEADFRNNSRTVVVRVGGAAVSSPAPGMVSLAVTEIMIVPAMTTLTVLQPVTIAVRVRNIGAMPVPCHNLGLRLLAGGVIVTEYALPCWVVNGFERNYLAPGEEALITGLTWTPAVIGRIPLVAEIITLGGWTGYTFLARPYTIYCEVVRGPVIVRPRSGWELADLSIARADIDVQPMNPTTDDSIAFLFTVRNLGGQPVSGRARVTVLGDRGREHRRVLSFGTLEAFAVDRLRVPFGLLPAGDYEVNIALESFPRVVERTLSNNVATLKFRVYERGQRPDPKSPPPQRDVDLALSPDDLTIDPAEPRANEPFRVIATIRNKGDDDAHNLIVKATISGSGLTQTALQFVHLIRGGDTARVTLHFPALRQPGRYTVRVEVNLPSGNDPNKGNNDARREFRVRGGKD
ncbi:MAG: hypothetical protein NZT92_10115 [Abditibacteriales bacterium]|nr:hypothetical protein [Abditibacteriales bacterium]MDW8366322.1 CARDB domain-containing protein [Abditibacteriales bacterium]